MKKLTVVLSFILLAVLCVLSASAAEDYIVWNFSDPVVAAKWTPSGSTQTEVTEKGLKIYGEGDDLNISYKADSEIILDNYKYLMIEFTDSDVGGGMQLYHWTEGCTGNPVVGQWVGPCAEDAVKQYILDLVRATRESDMTTLGVSPRGSIACFKAVRAAAFVHGRNFATPDDVKSLAVPVLAHRILLSPKGRNSLGTPEAFVQQLLNIIPVPAETAR